MPANRTVRGNLCPLRRRCVGYTGEEIAYGKPYSRVGEVIGRRAVRFQSVHAVWGIGILVITLGFQPSKVGSIPTCPSNHDSYESPREKTKV